MTLTSGRIIAAGSGKRSGAWLQASMDGFECVDDGPHTEAQAILTPFHVTIRLILAFILNS